MIIGLTGGIGSGKSEATRIFSSFGVPVIDTDIIARELTQTGTSTLKKIIDIFGHEYLSEDGSLNRKKMAQTVFNDDNQKSALENILHPEIRRIVKQRVEKYSSHPYIIIVVPLLLETSFHDLVDRVLVIDTDESVQYERIRQRDDRSDDEIKKIIQQQMPREARNQHADDIVDNSGTLDVLADEIKRLHTQYLSAKRE